MRNREAARYACWAAAASAAILIAVIVIYAHRRLAANGAHSGVARVPASVSQQSKNFSYSRVMDNRTIFTIEASQATEYRDKSRSLLENVVIKIYGKDGTRDDMLRAGSCSYIPMTGSIRCGGAVQISLRGSNSSSVGSANPGIGLETSNILFDRDSGNVFSPNLVKLRFPRGEGQATGILYRSQDEDVILQRNVKLNFRTRDAAAPVSLSADQLEFEAPEKKLILSGNVQADEEDRKFDSGRLELRLDNQMQPHEAEATENPRWEIRAGERLEKLSADKMALEFESGRIEKFLAMGRAHWQEISTGVENQLTASRLAITFAQKDSRSHSYASEILASGEVKSEWRSEAADRRISTDALRVTFRPDDAKGQQIESAETLAPAKVESKEGRESEIITAGRLAAKFDESNQPAEMRGSDGVKITRSIGGDTPQMVSGKALAIMFAPGGGWSKMQMDGNAVFKQADRIAHAEHLRFSHANARAVLEGSASLADSDGKISAPRIEINQSTGDVSASGGVTATYFGARLSNVAVDGDKPLPVNISADAMNASKSNGEAVFTGHARLWRGDDLIQSREMKFWRAEGRAEADGSVVASFVEPPSAKSSQKPGPRAGRPTIWTVHAQKLVYLWASGSSAGQAELSGGVRAESDKGSIASDSMELDLAQASEAGPQLTRATARGHVRVQQNGRVGSAGKGEYVAKEGKFVLSGGQPTLRDGSGNIIAGRELTFFFASDTILVDSQNGPRTITKHRVEK